MDSTSVAELVNLPNGILIVLILFGVYVMKQLRADAIKREDKLEIIRSEEKKEAIKREDKLMNYIDTHAESLKNINASLQENTQAISNLSESYSNLHNRIDTIERKI